MKGKSVEMEKSVLRKQVKELIAVMPNEQYNKLSAVICDKALQEPSIQEGETIAVTISNRPEVDTSILIKNLWKLGKRVAVPKCNAKTKEMDFYVIQDFSQLETVYMHLKEPIPSLTSYVGADDIDLIIVPGVVFDLSGYRVGYGGGYYDRYLTNYKGALLALVFDEQLFPQVPSESHDIPVHRILTQTVTIDCLHNKERSL